jgi:hypothetical protein
LTRISSETGVPVDTLQGQEVGDGTRLWRLGGCKLAGQGLWAELR